MSKPSTAINLAVVGATTLLGRDLLSALAEQNWQGQVQAFDAGRAGDEVSYGEDKTLPVDSLESADLAGIDIVIHAGSPRDAALAAKQAKTADAWLIDASGLYALDPSVPLILHGVNDAQLDAFSETGQPARKIIAVPQALAGALSLALNPLHRLATLQTVIVSTYQSVGVHGRAAMDELFSQTKKVFMAVPIAAEVLPKQLAFNCWPMVGDERDDGATDVEFQTTVQLKKLFGKDVKIAVNTTVIPAFTGDGMMVNADCADEITAIQAAVAMSGQQGVGVIDAGETLPTHADIAGEDMVFVMRLRNDTGFENGIGFWALADNPRAGLVTPLLQLLHKLPVT